ncbi:pilus assembly protein PilM [Fibrobacterales bacterium]|nr:pilus assembly protein PilM [Fibrobacterales bacterium]
MQLSNIISRIRGESQTVGIDIGHRLIKVAVVAHKPGEKGELLALEQELLPDGVLVDNEIKNAAVLIEKLQTVLNRALPLGLNGDFILAINWTSGVLCDRMLVKPVPKVSENELILQAAMGRSPFDDAGNVIDYSVIEHREEGIEAMIVAAKNSALTAWVNLFQALNIKLAAIDIDAFALGNSFTASAQLAAGSDLPPEGEEDNSTLLLNFGYSKAYVAYIKDGRFSTARSIFGGAFQNLQEQMSGPLNITPEKCGEILIDPSVKIADIDDDRIKSTKEFVFEEISMKLDTALRYFSSADNYSRPSKMILSGGGANILGLDIFLADRLSLDVKVLSPFGAVQIDQNRFRGTDWAKISCIYSVALGLALRKF